MVIAYPKDNKKNKLVCSWMLFAEFIEIFDSSLQTKKKKVYDEGRPSKSSDMKPKQTVKFVPFLN